MSGQILFDTIVDDDLASTRRLLRTNPALATFISPAAKLYRNGINHWIYAGDTPLHFAAAGYRIEIVRWLLAAGADPNATLNHRQSTPLHYAADTCLHCPEWSGERQAKTIEVLINAGAQINAPDKNGATPLHRAARTRGAAAVKCLLAHGANPLLKNKTGSTPFHLAVQNTGRGGSGSGDAKAAQRQIIREFLSFGVSVKLKDGKGNSIVDCARNGELRKLLCE